MEKYLKIHWSIRIILGIMLSIFILLVISSIYGIIFYRGIQEALIIMSADTENRVTIPIIIISLLAQLLGIIVLYKIFNYKRWAIILVFTFIGLPLLISGFGLIGYAIFMTYIEGIGHSTSDIIGLSIACTLIFIINGFFIKFNIELIRLYKNIKRIDTVDSKFLRITKPKFLSLFLLSTIPTIILGGLMILLYNPVVPLDIPESYFKIEGFDLDNPIYTEQTICKDFESKIGKMNETVRHINKEDTNSGVILAKKVLFSYPSDTQIKYQHITDKKGEKEKVEKTAELETYIKNYPEQWKEILGILRSQFTTESVTQLQELTHGLPQNINCNIRNDQNITEESFPRLTHYIIISRLYDAAIKLALLENNKEITIALLKSFHEFNVKFYNSNISLTKGMMGKALLGIEFGTVEYVIEHANLEQIDKIREIYAIPYDIKENQINSWKGEYYFFDHALTGRGRSIKQLSIPYILNGEDAFNRLIIFIYAKNIARANNDTKMLQQIEENKKLNINNFLTGFERGYPEGLSNWKASNEFFAKFYNPIGKNLVEMFAPSIDTYYNRYQDLSLYQDYIRYDLLGIKK